MKYQIFSMVPPFSLLLPRNTRLRNSKLFASEHGCNIRYSLTITLLGIYQVWGIFGINLSYKMNISQHCSWGVMEFEALLVK